MDINTTDESDAAEDFEIEEGWQLVSTSMLPEKSKLRYEKTYDSFKKWLDERNWPISEKSLLSYFYQRSRTLRSPGSLWAEYSMLKSMINLRNSINIAEFHSLSSFLKKKNVGHTPKKSKIFLREDINKFLTEAPDETYLMMKVAMIIGIAGACRRDELTNLTINDIDDRGSVIIIHIPNSNKNGHRTFTVIDNPDEEVHFLEILRRYVGLRPKKLPSPRFFIRFSGGRYVNQVVGINTMGRVPSNIAKFLNLEDPLLYTGHAFRRTSAALLMDTGSGILALKRQAGWRLSPFSQVYQEDSILNETQLPNKSFNENNSASTSSEMTVPLVSKEAEKYRIGGGSCTDGSAASMLTPQFQSLLNRFSSSAAPYKENGTDDGMCVLEEVHATRASVSKQNTTDSVEQESEREVFEPDFEKEVFTKKMEILDLEKETKLNELENSRVQLEYSRIQLEIIKSQRTRIMKDE